MVVLFFALKVTSPAGSGSSFTLSCALAVAGQQSAYIACIGIVGASTVAARKPAPPCPLGPSVVLQPTVVNRMERTQRRNMESS